MTVADILQPSRAITVLKHAMADVSHRPDAYRFTLSPSGDGVDEVYRLPWATDAIVILFHAYIEVVWPLMQEVRESNGMERRPRRPGFIRC
jgi:hypothetical protein